MTKQKAMQTLSQFEDGEVAVLILTADNVRTAIKTLGLDMSDYRIEDILSSVSAIAEADMFNTLRWSLEKEHLDPVTEALREVA